MGKKTIFLVVFIINQMSGYSFAEMDRNTQAAELIEGLKDSQRDIQYRSAWVIGQSRTFTSSELIAALIESLNDQDPWVRAETLRALSQIEGNRKEQGLSLNQEVVRSCERYAKDSDPFIRSRSLACLANIQGLTPRVLEAAQDEVWLVRRVLIKFLVWGSRLNNNRDSRSSNFDMVLDALSDQDPFIRYTVIKGIKKSYESRFLKYLVGGLYDSNAYVVQESLDGIAQLKKDPVAIEALIRFFTSTKIKSYKGRVQYAIEQMTGKKLEEVLNNDSSGIGFRIDADEERNQSSREIDISVHIKNIQGEKVDTRVSSALILAWSETPEVINTIINATRDKDPRVRFAAVEALFGFPNFSIRKSDIVLKTLFEASSDINPFVRKKAVEKLRFFLHDKNYRSSVQAFLRKLTLNEKDAFVKAEAMEGLSDGNSP